MRAKQPSEQQMLQRQIERLAVGRSLTIHVGSHETATIVRRAVTRALNRSAVSAIFDRNSDEDRVIVTRVG